MRSIGDIMMLALYGEPVLEIFPNVVILPWKAGLIAHAPSWSALIPTEARLEPGQHELPQ
jgi:hypothetical protein